MRRDFLPSTLRAEGELVRALLARTMELCRAGTHLTPMGAAHIFWACAALRVRDSSVCCAALICEAWLLLLKARIKKQTGEGRGGV